MEFQVRRAPRGVPSPMWLLWLLRLWGRRGFTRQPKNSKRAHFRALALQTPPKFNAKTPKRGRKKEICGGRWEKKREILGSPPFGAHTLGGGLKGVPAPLSLEEGWLGQKTKTPMLATQNLAKVGQLRLAGVGQFFFGPKSVWPKSASAHEPRCTPTSTLNGEARRGAPAVAAGVARPVL